MVVCRYCRLARRRRQRRAAARALGATVPSLGTGGTKRLPASLEEAWSWSRPTSAPLTGPRLAASLMWAQGSCELPTAKPRTRRSLRPLGGAFLDHDPLLVVPCHPSLRPSARASASRTTGYQPTETHRLQSGPQLTGRVVPSVAVTDIRRVSQTNSTNGATERRRCVRLARTFRGNPMYGIFLAMVKAGLA